MKITTEQDRILYDLFESKLTDISERVGYGEEEIPSEKHRVFEAAWEEYLAGIGVLRTLEVAPHHSEWSAVRRWYVPDDAPFVLKNEDSVLLGDPLYTTGKWLEIPCDLALKILTLGSLP